MRCLGHAGFVAGLDAGFALAAPVGHHPAGIGLGQVQQGQAAVVAGDAGVADRRHQLPEHGFGLEQRAQLQFMAFDRIGQVGRCRGGWGRRRRRLYSSE